MSFDIHWQGGHPQQQSQGRFTSPVHGNIAPSGRRDNFQSSFNMSNMAGALPDYQDHGHPQPPQQDSQRYSNAMGGPSNFGLQHFQGQSTNRTANLYPHHTQYTDSYQEAAAIAQVYGQMQAAQRSYSGGPSPIQTSYPNASYFQNPQQQYMYYSGQPGQFGHMAPPSPFNQHFGHYGFDAANRAYSSSLPPGHNQAGTIVRPGMPGKSVTSRGALQLANVNQVMSAEVAQTRALEAFHRRHEGLHANQSSLGTLCG